MRSEKMDKKILMAILLIGIALTFGCNTSNTNKRSTFVGGTNGILINFEENAPPNQVYDSGSNPFDVVVMLTNDGEYTVPKDKVTVSIIGIDPAAFGQSPAALSKHPTDDLQGVTKDASNNKQPSIPVAVEFNNFNYLGKVLGDLQYNIIAQVCYNYQTNANVMLCIKSNLMDTKSTVCNLNEKKTVENSGAPVQITLFTQSVGGKDKIGFQFTIEQKGNGNIFMSGLSCADTFANRDKVYVTVDTGLPGLKCTGFTSGNDNSGFMTLYQGKRTINCVQQIDTSVDSKYEKAVTITANYDYLEMKSQPIVVKKSM
ncbi:hypothetical protein COT07_01925 [Candidatus Woesearchaeota archaeon CG07_land_8_20_14_0_80_44_23]|nr:MAG: hypothetical protein COT07_01925 [Candidatus Woesearchaeota archaeon CG07_land_8_20_14_0_80_44_23]